jgi:hypothetical protein
LEFCRLFLAEFCRLFLAEFACGQYPPLGSTGLMHKNITRSWLAIAHNEAVDENSVARFMGYITAAVLWAFAVVVACMTVWPV